MATLSFSAATNYATGVAPIATIGADINGDGKTDLVSLNRDSGSLTIRFNNGYGIFSDMASYATSPLPTSVTSGDVNGDGKADLLVTSISAGAVETYINKGDGTLVRGTAYPTGFEPSGVIFLDVNSDIKGDIVVSNYNTKSQTISVLLNKGDGSFSEKTDYKSGFTAQSLIAADVNGDGKPDLIEANMFASSISVLVNNGNGTFAEKIDYPVGNYYTYSVISADVNGDGKPDLIATNSPISSVQDKTVAGSLSILINNGNGTFASKVDYATGNDPRSVTAADVNGDRMPDLIVVNAGKATVSVLVNNGDGTFAQKVDFTVGDFPSSVATADLNGDSKVDLIVANRSGNTLSVLMNSGAPDPSIIVGTLDKDTINSSDGNNSINGLAGTDTVVYAGARTNYTITKSSSGYTVKDNVGAGGVDTLINIERLQFSDKTVALDINNNAGQAYRLYQAAFARTPDNDGLKYWINKVDAGVDLKTIAAAFQASAEFQGKYGANPTADQLITAMYANVLKRAPDQAGNDYWKAQLNSGAVTKDSLLVNFSESNENQVNVIGVIQNGIDLT